MRIPHLVVVGFDEIVSDKYMTCIQKAIEADKIDSYSIIDLVSQKSELEERIKKLDLKPENVFYLPNPNKKDEWAIRSDFEPIFSELINLKGLIKVYIGTELKAHEGYLKYCVENDISSLTEKPIFAPMKDGKFNPKAINGTMKYLIEKSLNSQADHSIMTLSRYHAIYNDKIIDPLKKKVTELQAPVTSFHLRHAGGVWNLHEEYENREDHPYKYGYGMIMHGAYHYIDLVSQILCLNKMLFEDNTLSLTLSSFVAYPYDQNNRIPKVFSEKFDDYRPDWRLLNKDLSYGETDVTTTFCLKDKESNCTITLGTISLEQTTPSVRCWKNFPKGMYNKNGRISNVDLEAQLSTIHSVNAQVFDVPIRTTKDVQDSPTARISTRTNASLLKEMEYNTFNEYDGFMHSDGNREVMTKWLMGNEKKSRLIDHISTMNIVQGIAESIHNPGYPITFDFI